MKDFIGLFGWIIVMLLMLALYYPWGGNKDENR